MKHKLKSISALAASAAVVVGTVAPSIVAAWGDNGAERPGRRSYTIDQINHGVLGDRIVFNSISDSVDGDEKNFVSARAADAPAGTYFQGNDIYVENGKEYTIRMYVHNNNPKGYDVVAEDTHVFLSIPRESSKMIQVNGFIDSSNANPSEYWDYVNFRTENNAFHLEYQYGSAVLYNNGIGKATNGYKLGDDIVTKTEGQIIGYDKLDGKIPGCYQYDAYVTVRVKAVYDTDYTIEQKVRPAGGSKEDWTQNIVAKVGDELEFQVKYINPEGTNEIQNNVMIKNLLPENLQYVPNSTVLYNMKHPNGGLLTPDGDIVTRGVNIGNYEPNSNAYVRFRAKVVNKSLAKGSNTLVNWSQGGVGNITIQDYTTVMVQMGQETPAPAEYNATVYYVYENGTTAAPTYRGKYREGDTYEVNSPVIDGYTADKTQIRSTMGTKDQSFTVTYKADQVPEHTVTVYYVYENGTTAAPTRRGTYQEGDDFSFTSPTISGYTADKTVVSGTMGTSNQYYTVTYKADPIPEHTLTIRYVYAGSGAQAAPTFNGTYQEGDEFNIPSPTIEGYTADRSRVNGTMGTQDLSYTITYTQDVVPPTEYKVTIDYVYENGTTAHPSFNGVYQEGDEINVNSPVIEGYTADKPVISATMGTSDQHYTVVYKANPIPTYNLTVNYVYAGGGEAAPSFHGTYQEGDEFDVTSPKIDGYTPDKSKVGGTMGTEDMTITVTYTKDEVKDPEPTPEPNPDPTPVRPTPTPMPVKDTPVVETPPEEVIPDKLPSTGATAVAGTLITAGSTITVAGLGLLRKKERQ